MTLLSAAVRLGLVIFSFQRVQNGLCLLAQRRPLPPGALDVDRTAWAIGMASLRLLRDGPCLTQALAMQYMLERAGLPASLRLGVMKNPQGEILAHAWVESAGRVVIGGPAETLAAYTPLTEPE